MLSLRGNSYECFDLEPLQVDAGGRRESHLATTASSVLVRARPSSKAVEHAGAGGLTDRGRDSRNGAVNSADIHYLMIDESLMLAN